MKRALAARVLRFLIGTLLLAAGGIGDGRGLAAALMLGADGVLLGTRLWAAHEALVSPGHHDAVVNTCHTPEKSGCPSAVRGIAVVFCALATQQVIASKTIAHFMFRLPPHECEFAQGQF